MAIKSPIQVSFFNLEQAHKKNTTKIKKQWPIKGKEKKGRE